MPEQSDQLFETLETPFPAPSRFGWLRIWRRESAPGIGVSLVLVLVVVGGLLVSRLQWPVADVGNPSVEITAVTVSEDQRQALTLSAPSSSAAMSVVESEDVKAVSAGVQRAAPVQVGTQGKTLSEAPRGEASELLSDSDAVTQQAIKRLQQADSQLKALADSITDIDGARLKVKPGDGKSAEFFGVKSPGKRFVYVIDRSGSMASSDRRIKANKELLVSVMRLRSHQQFFVYYFNDGPLPMPYPGLTKASRKAKQGLCNWMRSVFPGGGTDPSSSLQRALEMKPDAVFLLTDGEFSASVLQVLRKINPRGGRQVSVNTIAIVSRGGEELLRQIAAENNGKFQFSP